MKKDKVITDAFDYGKIAKMTRIMPMIVVYERPDDYPDRFVARLWDAKEPTRLVALADTLEGIRETIPQGMVAIQRGRADEPCIVELWI